LLHSVDVGLNTGDSARRSCSCSLHRGQVGTWPWHRLLHGRKHSQPMSEIHFQQPSL
jgi:hypothetical protein